MNDTSANDQPDVFPYLQLMHQHAGSDLFFSVGAPPHMKVEGHSQPVGQRIMKAGEVQQLAYQLMTQKQIAEFERDLEMNLAVSLQGAGRYRVNVYYQRGEVAMVVRLIKSEIPSFEALGLPGLLEKLAMRDRGLILVTGAAGSGKSTTSMHVATALARMGHRVGALDLDVRQRSFARYLENRLHFLKDAGLDLPTPRLGALEPEGPDPLSHAVAALEPDCDFILLDCPGSHTRLSQMAHSLADTLITPMNDSFVDFDLLGEVDPVSLELVKPSIYSESVWEARKQRAIAKGRHATIDWLVVTNRLAVAEARNRKRLEERMNKLAKRVGFRVGPGLRDRVIYRELFPFGLTVADLSNDVRPVAVSLAHVAARQEMRNLMKAMGLEQALSDAPLDVAA